MALFRSFPNELPTHLESYLDLPDSQGSVCTLAPAIQQLLSEANLRVEQLTFLGVTAGPGSFTGLRVGLATAKMLALAGNIPVVPVDTLEAIAERFRSQFAHALELPVRLVTGINAFRQQVFSANWMVSYGQHLHRQSQAVVVDAPRWQRDPWSSTETAARLIAAELSGDQLSTASADQSLLEPCWVTGNALDTYPIDCPISGELSGPADVKVLAGKSECADSSPQPADKPDCQSASSNVWVPTAEQVGQLAWRDYCLDKTCSADSLRPNYIRSSAAEEKASSRMTRS